ncbi:MAG: HyaD/HybD family hydrogenase maturation endopeptidase [Alphaproteobacteria bacterium]|nr:HyaD/HybD family hydrogenase maturation endopeptidase [Alphaproteobacteria bacterium]
MRIMVLGIGNILMTDEGIGVRVVQEMESRFRFPDSVEMVDGGTSGMELLEPMMDLDHLIVVDAVRSGDPAGTLIRLEDDEVPALFQTRLSPHQLGLSDVLATLKLAGGFPKHLVLLGCEPKSLETNMGLSPEVEAKVEPLIDATLKELSAIGVAPLSGMA